MLKTFCAFVFLFMPIHLRQNILYPANLSASLYDVSTKIIDTTDLNKPTAVAGPNCPC